MLCCPFVWLPSLREVMKEQQTEDDEKHSTNRLPPLEPSVHARRQDSAICHPVERLPSAKEVLESRSGDPAASLTCIRLSLFRKILRDGSEDVPTHQTILHPTHSKADHLPQLPTGHLPPLDNDPAITASMLGGRATLTAEQEGWGGEQWAPSSPAASSVSQPQQPQRPQQQEMLRMAMRKNFEGQAMRRELKRQRQVWAKASRRRQQEPGLHPEAFRHSEDRGQSLWTVEAMHAAPRIT